MQSYKSRLQFIGIVPVSSFVAIYIVYVSLLQIKVIDVCEVGNYVTLKLVIVPICVSQRNLCDTQIGTNRTINARSA